MAINKNFYNQASATQLGWAPSWFSEKHFDEKLVRAVKKWQRNQGLSADGLVGPMTYTRIWTERNSEIDEHKSPQRRCGGNQYPVVQTARKGCSPAGHTLGCLGCAAHAVE